MKSFHEDHYSSLGLKNLTELVNKRIKGEVGGGAGKGNKKVFEIKW